MRIVWSDHAKVQSRKRKIHQYAPKEITLLAKDCPVGKDFKVRHGKKKKKVVYVCERTVDCILIITVYWANT